MVCHNTQNSRHHVAVVSFLPTPPHLSGLDHVVKAPELLLKRDVHLALLAVAATVMVAATATGAETATFDMRKPEWGRRR
jgi:hypothetical protein